MVDGLHEGGEVDHRRAPLHSVDRIKPAGRGRHRVAVEVDDGDVVATAQHLADVQVAVHRLHRYLTGVKEDRQIGDDPISERRQQLAGCFRRQSPLRRAGDRP